MKKIKNYQIGGGTGDIIEEAYIGNEDDFYNFISSIRENMDGYTEVGQIFTKPWHDGKFFNIYVDAFETAQNWDFIPECTERITVFYDIIEDQNEKKFIFGIYEKEEIPLSEEEVEEIKSEIAGLDIL